MTCGFGYALDRSRQLLAIPEVIVPGFKRAPLAPGPLSDLMDALHQLHLVAGYPSTRNLQRDIGGRGGPSHASIHKAFTGSKLPSWELVELLVEAMARRARLDTETEVERFRLLWVRVANPTTMVDGPPVGASSSTPADGRDPSHGPQPLLPTDGAPITIICGDLRMGDVQLGPLCDEENPNYAEFHSFADPDALVALLNHLHSNNPNADIRLRMGSRVNRDDLSNHLVLLGGIAWNDVTRRLNDMLDLPVRQVVHEKIHSGEVFKIVDGPNDNVLFLPRWMGDDPGTADRPGVLLEDVGMLARFPNPYNALRVLTYCNGIHSRGVLGAVRCLSDRDVREANERYLNDSFLGSDSFLVLMRVPVLGGRTISPSLSSPGTVLFHWPSFGVS